MEAMTVQHYHRDAKGPLAGIRVLDLSRLVAGNMLTLQLADFGAEVVKIEDPKGGDALRAWRVNNASAFWKVYARNKKSVAVDLRTVRGKEILLALVDKAQILVENFRPGTLEQMGLGPEVLHSRNSGLILIRISGWGQSGPYKDRPGFGTLVEAMSGFAARNGYPDRPPVLPPLSLADMVAGIYGAAAALVALRHREVNGGLGQVIDLPLLDPIVSVLGPEAAIFQIMKTVRPRVGSRSQTASPRNVFQTKDNRWLAISASMHVMVERLFSAIGRPEMIRDPRFATNSDRVRNAEQCEEPIAEFIAARSLAECLETFRKADVTAAPVYEVDQFIADPHVQSRKVLMNMPDEDLGEIAMHHVVPRLSLTPGSIRCPAPRLGEHNREILASIGLTESDVASLEAQGILGRIQKSER